MSLLSSFIVNQLVKSLEAQFIAHEAELKDAFVDEIGLAVTSVVEWVNSKIALRPPIEAPKD
tara:strand:+ start:894 stop:1079 length:186 start_codon:yes stop_codon:yes gene_type:complete